MAEKEFNALNPNTNCFLYEAVINPARVPPVPRLVQITSNFESSGLRISAHPFTERDSVPPSGINL